MISFSLFWFAIPLAILGAIALRVTVGLYRMFVPSVALVPERRPRPEPRPEVVAVTGESGADITDRPALREERFSHEPLAGAASVEADGETESGPMTVPAFKMAFAALAIVFFGTAFLTAFSRLFLMAIVFILQGKGMLGPGSPDALYLAVEVALLPTGLLLMARLLQDLLPTTFVNGCILVAWWLFGFVAYLFFLGLAWWAITAFCGWGFKLLQPSASTALLLICPVFVRVFFALDFPGRRGMITSR